MSFEQRYIGEILVRRGALEPDRLEAALYLVLALGTRVEALQTVFDTVLYALVVAGLEMQAIQLLLAAPVTPIQGVAGTKVQCTGYRLLTTVGQYHDYLLPQ